MEDQMRMVSFPKRMWNVVRVFFFMVRKGICSRKLLLDLSLLLKRGKIAGKAALANLMFLHHQHNNPSPAASLFRFFAPAHSGPPGEYEFSCSNTPAHPSFDLLGHVLQAAGNGRRSASKKNKKHSQARYKAQYDSIEEELAAVNGVLMQMQMVMVGGPDGPVEASPLLPGLGFGRSPAVRQLRVTDSPFPILTGKEDADCHVDELADEFIKRFYSQLRRQSLTEA